jgi:hypothetical protein
MGADPAKVRQALMGGFAASRILEVHGERMVKRTFEPGFRIELHQKDLNLALSSARAVGLSLPNTATAQELFNSCAAHGGKAWDHSAMVRALEMMANFEIGAPLPQFFRRAHDPSTPAVACRCSMPPSPRPSLALPAAHLPPPPQGTHDRHRRRQGIGRDGARAWSSTGRAAFRPGGHALRLCGAVRAHRDRRSAHPVPDEAAGSAAQRILALVSAAWGGRPGDLPDLGRRLLAAALPGEGLTLADKQAINKRPAGERRHHQRDELRAPPPVGDQGRAPGRGLPSGARGDAADFGRAGRPPCRHRQRPDGGRPATTCADALAILQALRHRRARRRCARCWKRRGESVKPGDPRLANSETRMIATPQMALEAAAGVARAAGITPVHILGDSIEGEARDVGIAMAGIARRWRAASSRSRRPASCCRAAKPR